MPSRFWTIPILSYHRVGEPKGDHVPTVTPESFEAQMAFLARRRYRVIRLEECVQMMTQGESLHPRSVVITFDDGYEETASLAAGVLQRFGFCATVFVAPGEIDRPGFMTWDQLRALSEDGFTVGSHTMHHTYLPLASSEQARQELVESKQALEQRLGRPVQWLSYPVGGFTETVQRLAKQAGYQGACTTNRGVSKRARDIFALRRIKMTERDRNPVFFSVKLSGYYDFFRRLEEPA